MTSSVIQIEYAELKALDEYDKVRDCLDYWAIWVCKDSSSSSIGISSIYSMKERVSGTDGSYIPSGYDDLFVRLDSLISTLPPVIYQAVTNFHLSSLPPVMIAKEIGCSLATLYLRVRKGYAQIEQEISL